MSVENLLKLVKISAIVPIVVSLVLAGTNGVFAQAPTKKTIIFAELTSYLDRNGTLTDLSSKRVVMNGTNDELMKQFPAVFKSFYEDSKTHQTRIAVYVDPNKCTATVANGMTADAAAIDNFKKTLQEMDLNHEVIGHRCWFLSVSDLGLYSSHVHRCW